MTDTKKYIKGASADDKRLLFESEAAKMWDIRDRGVRVSLPIDLGALKSEGMLQRHVNMIQKYFTDKTGTFKKNVTYYLLKEEGMTKIFLEESDGIFDWKQNFIALPFKVKIGDYYRRYHLGFFATAITVFYDLKHKGRLEPNEIINIYGYSHGAGAAPSLFSLIKNESEATAVESVKKFEPPRDIFRPCKAVRKECENHFNFIQGKDVVTKVPWWMRALGVTIKIRGQSLPWFKGLLRSAFDHDIGWTDPRNE